MKAYAIGHLHSVVMGPAIVEYLERIEATLAPFGGRYIIHGARPEVKEGSWHGDLIVIEFPDRPAADAWYASPAYQGIKPLRADNSEGEILLIDGVAAGHKAVDVLA